MLHAGNLLIRIDLRHRFDEPAHGVCRQHRVLKGGLRLHAALWIVGADGVKENLVVNSFFLKYLHGCGAVDAHVMLPVALFLIQVVQQPYDSPILHIIRSKPFGEASHNRLNRVGMGDVVLALHVFHQYLMCLFSVHPNFLL